MPPFLLVPVAEGEPLELAAEGPLVLGRGPDTALPVFDATISRHHAELLACAEGVQVRDLGSTNGTFVNGERVREQLAAAGDTVAFGSVVFRLQRPAAEPAHDPGPAPTPELATAPHAVSKILKLLPVAGIPERPGAATPATPGPRSGSTVLALARGFIEERAATRLAALLEAATELLHEDDVDRLLQKVVDLCFAALHADRCSLLAVQGDALELVPRATRQRGTETAPQRVPRAVSYQALTDRVAVLSENLATDERFADGTAAVRRACSALCVPLVGERDEVLGVLYLESTGRPFDEEDLQFMAAFAALAALVVAHQRLQQRERQEAATLARMQRYFAPTLAGEVALREGEVALHHPDRRPVVVCSCQLRHFGPHADALAPGALAELLGSYLSRLVASIVEYGGTLEAVSGQALLALWGAPLVRPDDADRALRAALSAVEAVRELARVWAARGLARLELAIGLAQGEAFVGRVGSGHRLEHAVAGTVLDLAVRLSAAADGPGILASDPFYRCLANPPPGRRQKLPGGGRAWRIGLPP